MIKDVFTGILATFLVFCSFILSVITKNFFPDTYENIPHITWIVFGFFCGMLAGHLFYPLIKKYYLKY